MKKKTEKMKIAIDRGPLSSGHKVRGIGRYTGEILHATGIKGVNVNRDNLGKYDLVHFTSFKPFEVILPHFKPKKTKFVLTIYDLIPLIYPKHYPPGTRGWIRFLQNKHLIKRSVDMVITISETSKKDICRLLGVAPKKVAVIYLAPREIFKPIKEPALLKSIQEKYSLPASFVLYVGDVNYNKNIPTLVKACDRIKAPLVICGKQAQDVEVLGMDIASLSGPRDWLRYLFGKPHPELSHYKGLLEGFKRNKNVIRLGFVPDSDLVAIYNLAAVYVQPSLYEGFGLPLVEAMACGTPAIAAKTQALVEVAGDAAVYFDTNDANDAADKIKKVMNNKTLASDLRKKGLQKAGSYSWKKTGEETLKIYRRLIPNPQKAPVNPNV